MSTPASSQAVDFFFFKDTAPTEISPLPLHAALPIFDSLRRAAAFVGGEPAVRRRCLLAGLGVEVAHDRRRSEEHTSELQSRQYLVCRLLLEKKKAAGWQLSSGVLSSRDGSHRSEPPP